MAYLLEGNYYLVVQKKGLYTLRARLSNKTPSLKAGEVAIKLQVEVPNTLFERPQLQAKVSIPKDMVTPSVLDATVLDNVREALQQQTGMDIKVSLVEPE